MNEEVIWFIIVVQGVICGGLSANIAQSKGRDGVAWFFAGLLFGILGLLASAGVAKAEGSRESVYDQRKCPFCAEAIKLEAVVCRFCGRDLPHVETRTLKDAEGSIPPPAENHTSENPPKSVCQSCGDKMTRFETRWKRGDLIVCYTCNVSTVFPRRVM